MWTVVEVWIPLLSEIVKILVLWLFVPARYISFDGYFPAECNGDTALKYLCSVKGYVL